MSVGEAPKPAVMPVDREAWRKEINLSNFVNTYYQYRDLQTCGPDVRRVLIVGPGQGLDAAVLKWLGYEITTFDIDETFRPDHIGSVHEMTMFSDRQFDAVIASHVLEHLAVPYLDAAMSELARVARFSIVYLPVHGRHMQVRVAPGVRSIDVALTFDYFNWLEKPDGVTPRYCAGQHFWEIGLRGWRVGDLRRRFAKYFDLLHDYRNRDWNLSHNFVLKSKRHS